MQKRQKDAGVTLLEVLVVVAIIAMIATLATPRLMESFGRAKSQSAIVEIQNVKTAIQLYRLDTGGLPTQADGLGALLAAPVSVENWQGPYLDEEDLKDPWGREWIYRQPGEDDLFDLLSYGNDGQSGGTNEDSDISI
ncbi:type II secretion system major pseudopilin GspG [Cognatiyoonia sp. IB215182]|uniref:type II secretion system major pseudopilin GspG n=1 Tax=Cognatiyoonia sp. IB215182 TaxID=3097353 RepID=UPI002A10D3B3|nr:type II secretion system major pseudopilin GspG [Cognatiyoonia sp. IB215182]MDX8355263.1 type II secretion system major pseudopilin GspG [Cognatiyoonia sp. IB215182]